MHSTIMPHHLRFPTQELPLVCHVDGIILPLLAVEKS